VDGAARGGDGAGANRLKLEWQYEWELGALVVVVRPCGRLERDDVEGVVDSQYVQVCSVEWWKSRRRDSAGLWLTFIVEHRAWQDLVTCQSHHAEAPAFEEGQCAVDNR
jgi:hypothetical protein